MTNKDALGVFLLVAILVLFAALFSNASNKNCARHSEIELPICK